MLLADERPEDSPVGPLAVVPYEDPMDEDLEEEPDDTPVEVAGMELMAVEPEIPVPVEAGSEEPEDEGVV